ncbi:hypothetical protein [Phaeodactylibacter luteus]|uniref:Outer membrane beta-barrel protein n=1 Tax=Phaeodactylibacter luteus TaxID=1564516 RepID=A0A5C6RYA4_9BACT|nr:hypothetical protein [Phaeodactylibacter luteus]TXB66352.1 hypothetical protein FRY97_05945 [Phaeodactylibacter luteus]
MHSLFSASVLLFFYALPAFGQSPQGVQAYLGLGIGRFATFGDFAQERMTEALRPFKFSEGNLATPITGGQAMMGANLRIAPRLSLSLQGSYFFRKNGKAGQDRTLIRGRGTPDETVFDDFESRRSLAAFSAALIGYWSLTPSTESRLEIGTGLAHTFRKHRYQTFAWYNFTVDNQIALLESTYSTVRKNSWGIPFGARYTKPLSERLSLLCTFLGTFHFNEDFNSQLTFALGYTL